MSPQLLKHLRAKLETTSKVVTVATGAENGILGMVRDLTGLFEDLEAQLDFTALKNVPFNLFFGRPILKRWGGVLDFRAKDLRLSFSYQEALVSMLSA